MYLDEDIFGDDDSTLYSRAASDELSEWQATTLQTDQYITNPIQYWYRNRQQWPCLALMAIDLLEYLL